MSDLIERLRGEDAHDVDILAVADALESQAKRIAELEALVDGENRFSVWANDQRTVALMKRCAEFEAQLTEARAELAAMREAKARMAKIAAAESMENDALRAAIEKHNADMITLWDGRITSHLTKYLIPLPAAASVYAAPDSVTEGDYSAQGSAEPTFQPEPCICRPVGAGDGDTYVLNPHCRSPKHGERSAGAEPCYWLCCGSTTFYRHREKCVDSGITGRARWGTAKEHSEWQRLGQVQP